MNLSEFSRFYQRNMIHFQDETALSTNASLLPRGADFEADFLHYFSQSQQLNRALRQARTCYLMRLMQADVLHQASLENVGKSMTELAEVALAITQKHVLEKMHAQYGIPMYTADRTSHLLTIGMGKLGGSELNISSDIDLVFVYSEDGHAQKKASIISIYEFYTRAIRQICNTLNEHTEHGFVFRVDTRLRPNGDSGPPVVSLAMLEEYLSVQGREWERFAWLKSRVLNPEPSGVGFEDALRLKKIVEPFVYRRYMDFGIKEALRTLHSQIRTEANRKESTHPYQGRNIKLGVGGIREIEFLVQVLQVAFGGKLPQVRSRNTLRALKLLVNINLIPKQVAQSLTEHYTFLRKLENRIQYLEDAQTHCLPNDIEDLERLAWSMNFSSRHALLKDLNERCTEVAFEFERVLGKKQHNLSHTIETFEQIEQRLAQKPYAISLEKFIAWTKSLRFQALTAKGIHRIIKIFVYALESADQQRYSDHCFSRLIDVLEAIGRRESYFALLSETPIALNKLLDLLEVSSNAARYVSQHPNVLDELLGTIEPSFSGQRYQEECAAWRQFLTNRSQDTIDELMDLMRREHQAEMFHILMRDLSGSISVEQVADQLSLLADNEMMLALQWAWQSIPQKHCKYPQFAVIAYGKWGGKELGYASDLDLTFVFEDEHPDALTNYIKLARRLITWFTTQTSAGKLYDLDTRLRPNGQNGLLVCSIESFRDYQMQTKENAAWTWEHQALTRARFGCGDTSVGAKFESIRAEVLSQPRTLEVLRTDIGRMRNKMLEHFKPETGFFHLKQSTGAMIDVEFAVQFLVLAHAHQHVQLLQNSGCIALLHEAENLGLLPQGVGQAAANSYRELRRLQHLARLNDAKETIPEDMAMPLRNAVTQLSSYLALFNFV